MTKRKTKEVPEMTDNQTPDQTSDDDFDLTSDMGETEMDIGEEVGDEVSDVVHEGEIVTDEEANHALTVNGNSDKVAQFYASVGEDIAEELREAVATAKSKMLDARDNAVEAGRALNAVRGLLEDRKFGAWLKVEFGKTDRTARNFMALANAADAAQRLLGNEGETKILQLKQTVAYSLGAETLPEEDREEIIVKLDRGEFKDEKELVRTIVERKEIENERREGGKPAKASKGSKGDGEGDGEGETFNERRNKYREAQRRHSAYLLAVGLIVSEEDGGGSTAQDVNSLYGEIGSGTKGKLTPEDHVITSETILAVAKAYQRGGLEAVEKLKPEVPPEPVAKSKKGKKASEGDD